MRKGFTLVEILIVLAVVAALAAFAWPAVRASMARSKSAQCLSNLRQIGAGLQLYLIDNEMIFPDLAAARADRSEEILTVDVLLQPYVEDERIFSCPADITGQFTNTGTSYFWNSTLNGQPASSLNMFGIVSDHSRIPVLVDKEGWHKHARHRVNHLFADGHASSELRLFAE